MRRVPLAAGLTAAGRGCIHNLPMHPPRHGHHCPSFLVHCPLPATVSSTLAPRSSLLARNARRPSQPRRLQCPPVPRTSRCRPRPRPRPSRWLPLRPTPSATLLATPCATPTPGGCRPASLPTPTSSHCCCSSACMPMASTRPYGPASQTCSRTLPT